MGQHIDHDFSVGSRLRDGGGHGRACFPERCQQLGNLVVDNEVVPGAEDSPGHSLAHTAKADETNLHSVSP